MMIPTVLAILPWIERLRRWTITKRCLNDMLLGSKPYERPLDWCTWVTSDCGNLIYV